MTAKVILSFAFLLSAHRAGAEVVPLPFPKSPANNEPYKIDSVYGPRLVTKGSFFHKGIDLNRRGTGGTTGNDDMNEPISAAESGAIYGVGRTTTDILWIGIDYGQGRTFAYLHILPWPNDAGYAFASFSISAPGVTRIERRQRCPEDECDNDGYLVFKDSNVCQGSPGLSPGGNGTPEARQRSWRAGGIYGMLWT